VRVGSLDNRARQPESFRKACSMLSQDVVDLGREAVLVCLKLSAPALVVGLLVGLAVGLFQAVTQIQEQSIAFVPKLIATIVALSLTLPWLLSQMVDYTRELIENIPATL
jgi:flagellar biosynthetic protein FliQ